MKMSTTKPKSLKMTTAIGVNVSSLESLRDRQKQFMAVLGISSSAIQTSDILKSPQLDDAAQGIVLEAVEILNELTIRSKPWKRKPLDRVHADMSMELIDVLFYVLELSVLLGIEACDIEDLYLSKLKSNLKRIIDNSSDECQIEGAKKYLEELRG